MTPRREPGDARLGPWKFRRVCRRRFGHTQAGELSQRVGSRILRFSLEPPTWSERLEFACGIRSSGTIRQSSYRRFFSSAYRAPAHPGWRHRILWPDAGRLGWAGDSTSKSKNHAVRQDVPSAPPVLGTGTSCLSFERWGDRVHMVIESAPDRRRSLPGWPAGVLRQIRWRSHRWRRRAVERQVAWKAASVSATRLSTLKPGPAMPTDDDVNGSPFGPVVDAETMIRDQNQVVAEGQGRWRNRGYAKCHPGARHRRRQGEHAISTEGGSYRTGGSPAHRNGYNTRLGVESESRPGSRHSRISSINSTRTGAKGSHRLCRPTPARRSTLSESGSRQRRQNTATESRRPIHSERIARHDRRNAGRRAALRVRQGTGSSMTARAQPMLERKPIGWRWIMRRMALRGRGDFQG